MSQIVSKPDHGSPIGNVDGKAVDIANSVQLYFDDITTLLNNNLLGQTVIMPSYTVATVPNATQHTNGVIIVSDESGGRTLATSDGIEWRRVSDGAIIS